ncbi:MAG: class I SAM-dependent methyltransferase [Rhodospirillaceae bacterium]|nr:class I SAM-dependent methyltransferase [Rhodospirillaceae bacterium]
MSDSDKARWDERYRTGAYAARSHPSAVLTEWLPQLELRQAVRTALDVACGIGRNALYLASRGWQVHAVDISEVALARLGERADEKNLPITRFQADLEALGRRADRFLTAAQYDLVLMIRYTNLPLLDVLQSVLRKGGYLIVEEHLLTDEAVAGPKNPDFRVAPGALKAAAAGLEVVAYREGLIDDPDGRPVALAQLIARRR